MDPRDDLYSRQRIASLTGVDDTTLNYWMREGILRPAFGGGGKGQHRRFPFSEINLAVIFRELRSFGVSMPSLRNLAEQFHTSLDFMAARGFTYQSHWDAYDLVAIRSRIDKYGFDEFVVEPDRQNRLLTHFPWLFDLNRHTPEDILSRGNGAFAVNLDFEQSALLQQSLPFVYGRTNTVPGRAEQDLLEAVRNLNISDFENASRYFTIAYAFSKTRDFSTTATPFCRDEDGTWYIAPDITNLPAGTVSFVGVDVEALSVAMWASD